MLLLAGGRVAEMGGGDLKLALVGEMLPYCPLGSLNLAMIIAPLPICQLNVSLSTFQYLSSENILTIPSVHEHNRGQTVMGNRIIPACRFKPHAYWCHISSRLYSKVHVYTWKIATLVISCNYSSSGFSVLAGVSQVINKSVTV